MVDAVVDGTDRHLDDVPSLVLASSSPRRAELLDRLGLVYTVRAGPVDESPAPGEQPEDLVARLSRSKVDAAWQPGDGLVLGADTVVVLEGASLGKPVDEHDAAAMLRRLSGRTHEVLTGVCVRHGHRHHRAIARTRVHMRALTDAEVAWYVATGEPLGKAGAYAIQGAGAVLLRGIEGCDTNVIGLPLSATVELLRAAGLDPLTPAHGAGA